MKCHICGYQHDDRQCGMIKAFEYYPILDMFGSPLVKRVEFVTFVDIPKQPDPPPFQLPSHITRQ